MSRSRDHALETLSSAFGQTWYPSGPSLRLLSVQKKITATVIPERFGCSRGGSTARAEGRHKGRQLAPQAKICAHYLCALFVRIICAHYLCALFVRIICVHYLCALFVRIICVHYLCALFVRIICAQNKPPHQLDCSLHAARLPEGVWVKARRG